jgi:hypothetical protein
MQKETTTAACGHRTAADTESNRNDHSDAEPDFRG